MKVQTLFAFTYLLLIYFFTRKIDIVNAQSPMLGVPAYSVREPSYLIVAPRVVRPSEKVRISCTIFNKLWQNLVVKALIFTNEHEVVSGTQELMPNVPATISMKMPNNIREDSYFIRLEGRLPTGELTFSNESSVIFEQKAVSIMIQLERPDYRHNTTLRFRCIAIYPDMSAYYGTMDVFVISPRGIVLKIMLF